MIQSSCNWAVGTFVLSSIASLEYCRYERQQKAESIKRAIEEMNKPKPAS
jgi:hypothetical protein